MTFDKPFDRITVEEGKLVGKPCIREMRLSVVLILNLVATYPDRARLFAAYPELEEEDLAQALNFAAAALVNMRMPTQSRDDDGEPAIKFTPVDAITFLKSLE